MHRSHRWLVASTVLGLAIALGAEGQPPAAAPPAAAPAAPLANLDFTQGELGQPPPAWLAARGSAVTVADHPQGGGRSALLKGPDKPDSSGEFGNLMRFVDAAPYRGKRVRFRAAVKFEAPPDTAENAAAKEMPQQAQLWLRVDRPGGTTGFFDNMDERPITAPGWDRYEIVGKVAADAEKINLGLLLLGSGRAWLSAASLEALPSAVDADQPPRPLDARGLDNLVAFTRLAGDVRYFHPSDQAAAADWNRFILAGVQTVEKAAGPAELAHALTTLFLPLAPTVRVFLTSRPQPPIPAELLAPPAGVARPRIVAWRHFGMGIAGSGKRNVYRSERIDDRTPDKDPDGAPLVTMLPEPGKPLLVDLGGGASALVPLALYADDKSTLPRIPAGVRPQEPAKPAGFLPSGNDRATRLADVVEAWNVFEHFYPYFDVVATDWPAALRRALTGAATDGDEVAFAATLNRLVAALHDGHGGVHGVGENGSRRLPLLWDWVEGRLVVTQVDRVHGTGLEAGDVVLALDGKKAPDLLAAEEELISAATPQWGRYRAMAKLAGGSPGSVRLEVQRPSGETATVTVERSLPAYGPGALEERRPDKIAEVAPGIVYVDIGRVKDDDFKGALDRLAHAKGIIFDFRGYPTMSPDFLQHLTGKTIHSAQWHIPILTRPDRRQIKFLSDAWSLEPLAPRFSAKVAFVTDGRAISYAESCLGIAEYYRLGEIVGGPTAGTNGNVNPFKLPGGYSVYWTGMQVLKQDGSRHHGVGIQPTIPVSRTLKGVTAGRDELLEKAIEVVSR